MLIMLTNRCHMGCTHCMQDAGPDGSMMTEETFGEVLAFASEAGPMVVNVTGGEPTEHPQWDVWTRQLLQVKSVALVSVLTNGAWIEDREQRFRMARLVRESKGRVRVQVYSNPLYYPDHEWTVAHEQQFRSIGCMPDFTDPIMNMQDLGRARQNCSEEVEASDYVAVVHQLAPAGDASPLDGAFLHDGGAGREVLPPTDRPRRGNPHVGVDALPCRGPRERRPRRSASQDEGFEAVRRLPAIQEFRGAAPGGGECTGRTMKKEIMKRIRYVLSLIFAFIINLILMFIALQIANKFIVYLDL